MPYIITNPLCKTNKQTNKTQDQSHTQSDESTSSLQMQHLPNLMHNLINHHLFPPPLLPLHHRPHHLHHLSERLLRPRPSRHLMDPLHLTLMNRRGIKLSHDISNKRTRFEPVLQNVNVVRNLIDEVPDRVLPVQGAGSGGGAFGDEDFLGGDEGAGVDAFGFEVEGVGGVCAGLGGDLAFLERLGRRVGGWDVYELGLGEGGLLAGEEIFDGVGFEGWGGAGDDGGGADQSI